VKSIGIVIADRGSAIVTAERDDENALLVTSIERLPFDLGAVTDRVYALKDPEARHVIDAEGLGSALWAVLGSPDDEKHWQLYSGRGLERQALVDELLVAVQQDRFRFAAGLDEQPAMTKAMVNYRRQVKEDGLIGSELVVAMLLAISPPPPMLVPLVGWLDHSTGAFHWVGDDA
jgi:hypothetical protein